MPPLSTLDPRPSTSPSPFAEIELLDGRSYRGLIAETLVAGCPFIRLDPIHAPNSAPFILIRAANVLMLRIVAVDHAPLMPLLDPLPEIQRVVAAHFGTRLADMAAVRGPERIVRPRQIAMYFARELTELTLEAIASQFGACHHGSVLHACRRIADLISTDRKLAQTVLDLRHQLQLNLNPQTPTIP